MKFAWKQNAVILFVAVSAVPASAQIRITEYQYTGTGLAAEYVEFTNVGGAPINMTGWSYDDSSDVAGTTDLSAFGTVDPGESVVMCETDAGTFASAWGLSGVGIIGLNAANLGRGDQINLYDNTNTLVDRLTYGDQDFPGTIRASGSSGWGCTEALGTDDIGAWVLSVISDDQNSVLSSEGNVGNPGSHITIACPTPPAGACCEEGVCNERTPTECAAVGLYQGDGTTCGGVSCPGPSNVVVRITEYMHGGNGGEYIEFTNLDAASVDFTGWSFSDETRLRGQVDLSALGTLDPGASAILTETESGDFVVDWSLSGVAVIGGNTVNIGQDDEINIYDPSGALVDRLTYGTTNFPNSIDADGAGGWPCSSAVGMNDIIDWRRATVGDGQGSYVSLVGDIGSPGSYSSINCGPGSCCVAGSCSVETKGQCDLLGGLFKGDGTDCSNDPCPTPSNATMRITEFMYSGLGSEFAEFTNLGSTSVDLTDWSFSDAGVPGVFDLTPLGTLAPGESALMTDVDPAVFRADWGLAPTVPVVRIPTSELGRNDDIQLYDSSGSLIDEIDYGDEDFPGSIRTLNSSGWPMGPVVGENDITGWVLSAVDDAQSSVMSSSGDVGNPGSFVLVGAPIPATSTWGLATMGLLLAACGTLVVRRRTPCA